jgi:hypothetical protein
MQGKRWLENAFARYPVATAAAAAAVCTAFWRHAGEALVMEVFLLVPLAVLANFAWTWWNERRWQRRGPRHWAGLAALAALAAWAHFGWLGGCFRNQIPGDWPLVQYALVLAAAGLLASAAGGGPWRRSFWRLVLAAAAGVFFAGVAVAGLMLAGGCAQTLFGWRDWEMPAFVLGCCVAGPAAAAAFGPRPDGSGARIPRWAAAAFRWGLLPLCAAYAVLLLAHLGRFAVRGQWPDGMVAWPILSCCAAGWAVWALGSETPPGRLRRRERLFHRAFPFLSAALSVVLAAAVSLRVGAYGVTVARALGFWAAAVLAAAGLWAGFAPPAGTAPRPFRATARRLAVAVALAAFAAAWGGPLSAGRLAERSQWNRFWCFADRMLAENAAPRDRQAAWEEGKRERDRLWHLRKTFGTDACRKRFRAGLAARGLDRRPDLVDAGDLLGCLFVQDEPKLPEREWALERRGKEASAADWERLHWRREWRKKTYGEPPWSYRGASPALALSLAGLPFDFDDGAGPVEPGPSKTPLAGTEWNAFRDAALAGIEAKFGPPDPHRPFQRVPAEPEELVFVFSLGGREYAVLFDWLYFAEGRLSRTGILGVLERAAGKESAP